MPCTPARARMLLKLGKARVYRNCPFTILLIGREEWVIQTIEFKVDPGSKITGMALVLDENHISVETVRFDMQTLQNPEIDGTQYQQGTLFRYEVREYLLEKWKRTCAYCDEKNVPFEIDRIHPKSLGGSNCVANLTLACHACNVKRGIKILEIFYHEIRND